MARKWQIVVLSVVVCSGFKLVASEVKANLASSNELKKSNPMGIAALRCSAELRKSIELRKQEKEAQKNMYYPHCGGNTPPEYLNHRYERIFELKPHPYGYFDFPGQ